MTDFARVLLPLDGSERTQSALDWERVLGAQRTRLLRVCPADAEGYVAAAGVSLAEVAGDPAERIVAEAADTELIVMSTQGAGHGGRRLFGSVAGRVSRHSPVLTLLLRGGRAPEPTAALQRIVIPLDGSSVAERAVPLGTRLAAMPGAAVHLVAVHESGPDDAALDAVASYLGREAAAIAAHDVHVATEVRADTIRLDNQSDPVAAAAS